MLQLLRVQMGFRSLINYYLQTLGSACTLFLRVVSQFICLVSKYLSIPKKLFRVFYQHHLNLLIADTKFLKIRHHVLQDMAPIPVRNQR